MPTTSRLRGRASRAMLCVIALLATVPVLHAQAQSAPATATIRGRVIDAESGAPLRSASVTINGLSRTVLTNASGAFVLPGVPFGEHTVFTRQIGYRVDVALWEVGVDGIGEATVEIALVPEPVVLEGIRVQADRLERRRRAVGVSARMVDRDLLRMTSARDMRDLVVSTMGMTLLPCPTGAGECLRVRGSAIRPSVWIDERRSFSGLDELDGYSPADFYRVEVYAGGRVIRVYTTQFIERVARNPNYRPMPLLMW